ncbi:hypothetical protein ACJX0J_007443, partial [Zea mays]
TIDVLQGLGDSEQAGSKIVMVLAVITHVRVHDLADRLLRYPKISLQIHMDS